MTQIQGVSLILENVRNLFRYSLFSLLFLLLLLILLSLHQIIHFLFVLKRSCSNTKLFFALKLKREPTYLKFSHNSNRGAVCEILQYIHLSLFIAAKKSHENNNEIAQIARRLLKMFFYIKKNESASVSLNLILGYLNRL